MDGRKARIDQNQILRLERKIPDQFSVVDLSWDGCQLPVFFRAEDVACHDASCGTKFNTKMELNLTSGG